MPIPPLKASSVERALEDLLPEWIKSKPVRVNPRDLTFSGKGSVSHQASEKDSWSRVPAASDQR